MNEIKKNTSEYRRWKKRNDEKNFRNRMKKKKARYKIKNKNVYLQDIRVNKTPPIKVPKIFSIINNADETISFFNSLIKKIEQIRKEIRFKVNRKNVYCFKIDMSDVEMITGDALMYLLTVIKNTRGKKHLPINWIGNFPKNKEIKEFLQASGYLDYMKTDKKNIIKTNDKIQIRTGKKYVYNDKTDIRKEVVDFTMEKLKKDKKDMQFLFNILTEVITNIEHAYNEKNERIFDPAWYIMVENKVDRITYTFMDNGLGIPTTVRKKMLEEIFEYFNWEKEYIYISTALDGTIKRTQTKQKERSTGLPDVYEKFKDGKISNLIIISNKAYYCENNARDINEKLEGTIICWEIRKENNNVNKSC